MASIISRTQKEQQPNLQKSSIRGIRIVATGSYVPDIVIKNSDLRALGCDEQWIVQRTGILERRHCRPEHSTSDLAFFAAERCLAVANLDASDVDMIIVATMTPDHFTPATSAIVQNRLQCDAVAMDLNAACSGFMYALVTAGQFVKSGSCKNVLVIGADAMSRVIDPQDPKTYPLFGDAAGAVLVTADSDINADDGPGILAYRLATEGQLGHLISVPGSCARMPASQKVLDERQQFMKMNGRPVFKWAVRVIPTAVHEVLRLANLSIEDIDLLLLHQANRRIIDAALNDLDISEDKVFGNLQHYGNTSAASIPLLLDEAIGHGLVSLESRILMCGFGSGLTWGSCIYQG